MALVPKDELLYADVNIKNEDVGFTQIGQKVQIKLAIYPFQRYGMVSGKLTHLSADATELNQGNSPNSNASNANSGTTDNSNPASSSPPTKPAYS